MLASEAQIALGLGTEATGGNNNGIIDNGSWEEAAAVWQHLAAADFIVGQYNGATKPIRINGMGSLFEGWKI